jgi:flagellar motor protein MotB
MSRSISAWPALTDLFSGLLVATFGGLMLFTGMKGTKEDDPVKTRVNDVRTLVADTLNSILKGEVRSQGDDVFLDVGLNFERNKDVIVPTDRVKVKRACDALRRLFAVEPALATEVEIWIEGHTDSLQVELADPREKYLFNWRLSGNRAASVLHEFHACGLEPGKFRIFAIGYADSRPKPGIAPGSDRQRRTTFRVRPDTCAIESKIKKQANGKECVT